MIQVTNDAEVLRVLTDWVTTDIENRAAQIFVGQVYRAVVGWDILLVDRSFVMVDINGRETFSATRSGRSCCEALNAVMQVWEQSKAKAT